jgi:hypothetical protein
VGFLISTNHGSSNIDLIDLTIDEKGLNLERICKLKNKTKGQVEVESKLLKYMGYKVTLGQLLVQMAKCKWFNAKFVPQLNKRRTNLSLSFRV